MIMPHIYVIAGHGNGDPGSVGNGYEEQERVRALAQRIKDLGGDDVTLHPFSDNAYTSGAINDLNIPKDWEIIELHMDALGSQPRGAHVIVNSTKTPDAYDMNLANALSVILPGRSEKIVKRNNLANPRRAAAKGYSYRLVENGFISNSEDVKIFNDRMDDIARTYLSVFGIGVKEGITIPQLGKEGSMQCIFRPNGEDYLVYYDGVNLHPLNHPDEAEAIQIVARQTLGKEIPMFELGAKNAPWATRLFGAVQRTM